MNKPDLLKPALISGIVFGIASALPVIGIFNCCCLLVLACGVFAAFLLMRQSQGPVTYGSGAVVGLLAGIFGAFSVTIVDTLIQITVGKQMKEISLRILENLQSKLPPNAMEYFEFIEQQIQKEFTVFDMIFAFLSWFVLFAAFSTLGGILGVALFRKKREEAKPPSIQSSL